jgi:hypothetical protein
MLFRLVYEGALRRPCGPSAHPERTLARLVTRASDTVDQRRRVATLRRPLA